VIYEKVVQKKDELERMTDEAKEKEKALKD
jgi:hypothetical protein